MYILFILIENAKETNIDSRGPRCHKNINMYVKKHAALRKLAKDKPNKKL